MKLVDLDISCPPTPIVRREFNRVGELVAFRYLYCMQRTYDSGQFRKIVVSVVTPDSVRDDQRLLNVLVLQVGFDFSNFNEMDHDIQQQTLLRLLHERLMTASKRYGFATAPLEVAFNAAAMIGDDFLFLSKRLATFAKPYRSAQLAFRCDGSTVQFLAKIKTARSGQLQIRPLKNLDIGPSVIGYLIEDFQWLNEDQLLLQFTQAAKAADIVLSI